MHRFPIKNINRKSILKKGAHKIKNSCPRTGLHWIFILPVKFSRMLTSDLFANQTFFTKYSNVYPNFYGFHGQIVRRLTGLEAVIGSYQSQYLLLLIA